MTNIRKLNAEEFDLINSTPGGELLKPSNSIVFISEEDGEVVGRAVMTNIVTLEGWVKESHRQLGIGRELQGKALEEAKKIGLSNVLTAATNTTDEFALLKLGWTKLSASLWKKEV